MRLFKDGLSKSATFWLGLFSLCFLAWLWVDSVFYETRIGFYGRSESSLTMVAGIVEAEWITGYPVGLKSGIGWGRDKRRKPVNIIWSPDFCGSYDGTVRIGSISAADIPIRTYYLRLALWIPFVVFTFFWCIAFRFSLKRRKRIQQSLDCIR